MVACSSAPVPRTRIRAPVRERESCRRDPASPLTEARTPQGSGPFRFPPFPAAASTARGALFNNLPRCGAGSGRRCIARSGDREFDTRDPLHFGCALAAPSARSRGNGRTGCARGRAPCAARAPGQPAGHSRPDTAEVERMSCSSSGQGSLTFTQETRVRFPYTTPATRSRAPTRRVAETGRKDGAAPEPVTGTHIQRSVNSVARVPPCRGGSRGFDSRTDRHLPRWLSGESAGLRNRRSHVRIVRGAPVHQDGWQSGLVRRTAKPLSFGTSLVRIEDHPRIHLWRSSQVAEGTGLQLRRALHRARSNRACASKNPPRSAAGSARALGARGRPFDPGRGDQAMVPMAQRQRSGL